VIGTHHIDRYAAIEQVRDRLKQNPKSLADWVILGELAHEVGVDSAPSQATGYFKLSREAYERALALAPDKPGLKAAVDFAREYEQGSDRFAGIRTRATQAYLDARRRDLEATDYVPAVRVFPTATTMGADLPAVARAAATPTPVEAARGAVAAADPAPAVSPPPTNSTSTDVANFGVRQIYSSTPTYAPYYTPTGKPLTYQQYRSAYFPSGLDTDAGALPVTLQRYSQQSQLDANVRPVDSRVVDPALANPGATTSPGERGITRP